MCWRTDQSGTETLLAELRDDVAWLFAAVYWSPHQPGLEMNAQNIYKFAFLTTEHESCQMNASAAITKSRSTRAHFKFLGCKMFFKVAGNTISHCQPF